MRRLTQIAQIWMVLATLFLFMGAGDDSARFRSLGHQVMCVCGCNYVLLECNHVGCPNSDRMRSELAAAVDSGESDALVFQGFVEKYGPVVLLAPPKTGFGRVAWVTPYVALIIGVCAVVFIVFVWNKRPRAPLASAGSEGTGPDLGDYRDQVRRDTGI
jgi:cytochrome c-type biogenesis protein CcmH/NrfF